MSDVNVAPPPAPSAPQPREAVINQNPVSTPNPIGSQAPNARVPDDFEGSKLHPQSRREANREAIKRAFQRASDPGPAKPRMGHNNPPEPTKRERPKEPPLDLKKRPPADDRPRAEHGHFAAREAGSGSGPSRQPGQPQAGGPQGHRQPAQYAYQQQPAHTPYRDPPQRMSERAKSEWHAAPESVRGEVHRMQHEFGQAYQRMRADADVVERIRPYHDMAQSHGTTLDRALANYVGMEDKLRADPIAGLDVIVHNLNLRTQDGQQLGLRDLAWHILNLSPEQHRTTQMQNSQTAIAQQLGQLRQQQNAVATQLQQLQYARTYTQMRGGVDRFAETHPRLDELGDLIVQELRVGYDLPTAYRRAELLRPASATHAAQTRTQTAQTRNPDRSIHGAPDSLNGHGRHRGKQLGRRDSIAHAIKAVSGSL